MQLEINKRFEKRSPQSLERARKTNLEKYGAITYTSTEAGKQKIREANFSRNGGWPSYLNRLKECHVSIVTEEKDFVVGGENRFKCLVDGHEWMSADAIPYCEKCAAEHKSAKSCFEKEFRLFLDELGVDYKPNKKFDRTYELDIWFESLNLGIELNGLFWHSELAGKGRTYHINKLKYFNDKKIRVVQIMEDEWNFKKDIVKEKIKAILNTRDGYKIIHARKCEIRRISPEASSEFVEKNHIQGSTGADVHYGAYFDGELVAVCSFSKSRIALGQKRSKEYELVRFCTASGTKITGVLGKLIKKFVTEMSPGGIISYADRRFTDEVKNIYTKNGFSLASHTSPGYWYIKGHIRLHRFNFQKHKLVKDGADPKLTEWEIMKQRKYNRIWDCGQFKYVLKTN